MVDAEGPRDIALRHKNARDSAQPPALPPAFKRDREHRHRRLKTNRSLLGSLLVAYFCVLAVPALGPDDSLARTALLLIVVPLTALVPFFIVTSRRRWQYVHRIFEPRWTYLSVAILLAVSALIGIPIIQSGGDAEKQAVFVEVRVAAVFTLATFIPVVIALFLQGKPSMRIERGWIVWRSSFGVATGFYALLLGVAGVVAIFEIALKDGVPDSVAYLGVVTFFLVIFMLPVLLVSVAVCSGAPFTSQSAQILVWAHLRANRKEKAKGLIKDLRDVTIVEYKLDHRRAVRERLQALGDISENDDFDIKEASLDEIGFVGSEMILDRDLAEEAIHTLVSESALARQAIQTLVSEKALTDEAIETLASESALPLEDILGLSIEIFEESSVNADQVKLLRWNQVKLLRLRVGELMSLWATAVQKNASPLVAAECAKRIKDLFIYQVVYGRTPLGGLGIYERKLQLILLSYEGTVHEEAGYLLALSAFGHFADFPDAVLERLPEGSKATVETLTTLLLDTPRPDLKRYEKDIEVFVQSVDKSPTKGLLRSVQLTSLQQIASRSERHRQMIAQSCHRYVTDPDASVDGEANLNGYLALILKMVWSSNEEELPDKDKIHLLQQIQQKARPAQNHAIFSTWVQPQLRSRVTTNLKKLLRPKGGTSVQELASEKPLPELRDFVLKLLVQLWGAHIEDQTDLSPDMNKSDQGWLLETIRSYTRSVPHGDSQQIERVTDDLSNVLDRYTESPFAALSSFDVLASDPRLENQKKMLTRAYRLHEQVAEQSSETKSYFDNHWTKGERKYLLEGLATTLQTADEFGTRLPPEAHLDFKGKRIRVHEAQAAIIKIAIRVLQTWNTDARQILNEVTQDENVRAASIEKMSSLIVAELKNSKHTDLAPSVVEKVRSAAEAQLNQQGRP